MSEQAVTQEKFQMKPHCNRPQTGRPGIAPNSPERGGERADKREKSLLSAPQNSDHFKRCKHLLCFVSQSLTIYVTPSRVLGTSVNRHSTLLTRLRRHCRGQCQGKSLCSLVCVCVVVSYCSWKMKNGSTHTALEEEEDWVPLGP